MKNKFTGILAAVMTVLVAFAFLPTAQAGGCCGGVKKEGPGCDQQDCLKDAPEGSADAEPAAKPGTAAIKVPTIQCGMCVKTITRAIKSVEGVTEVTVDRKAKLAKVVFDPEKTTLEKIETAISKAGYAADDMKADAAAFEKLDDCCKPAK